jgi:hypothetical protein
MAFPTVQSARPVYSPEVPRGGVPDPGGATPVEHAYRTQQAVAADYTRWRQAHSPHITPEALKANAGAYAVSDAALQLPEVLKPVKQDAEDAVRKSRDIVKNTRVPDDDAGKQLAGGGYWDGEHEVFEAIDDPAKLVMAAKEAITDATESEIPVLAQRLSKYLGTRGVPTGWIPAALASKIPGLADAQAAAILAHRQHAVLLQNDNLLRNAMAKDVAAPPILDPGIVNAEPYTESSTD